MEFKSFNGNRWESFTQHRMETVAKLKELRTYANVKRIDEEKMLAHAMCLLENSYSPQILTNAMIAWAPELMEVGLLELYVLSRVALIMEPVYRDSVAQQKTRAEHITLEEKKDAPFKVIREFRENTFMSLVGWHLFELIGNRAPEENATTALDPFYLSSYNNSRATTAAVAAAAGGVTANPQRVLGQKLFDALVEYVVAQRDTAHGSSNYNRYEGIRVQLLMMSKQNDDAGIKADYMVQVAKFGTIGRFAIGLLHEFPDLMKIVRISLYELHAAMPVFLQRFLGTAPEIAATRRMQYRQGGLSFVVGHFNVQEKVAAARKHATRAAPPRLVRANGPGHQNGGVRDRMGAQVDGASTAI
ncbi:hypothetical protein SARC_03462 [Sphaeroforma arctica JP610]|uniref:Uncharacterized protein n=1 Tax=Sphaeroforma arctica JP610 TaxID=667725 RepID=A0A0L0G623_9EUKA|nr:hypothetical protein SARC_03462 [Sphaeroforma arctica JP610]KNC84301.1 hypothetical protein SARC_03462 [Sphaeroforma arctica JP610]|eukprot:XP_014158203.1 hypothetical protein SARC_03462 [Sphaeroforma arctica JP610]